MVYSILFINLNRGLSLIGMIKSYDKYNFLDNQVPTNSVFFMIAGINNIILHMS
jgi:hypothetical protein